MTTPASVQLITNSPMSGQRSMIWYGQALMREMTAAGVAVTERPGACFFSRSLLSRASGSLARKLDRHLVTPMSLFNTRAEIAHSIDPGNAVYFNYIKANKTLVTVHDMIPYLCGAGTLKGFSSSWMGRRLMADILKAIQISDMVVSVSEQTRQDVLKFCDIPASKIRLIPNGVEVPAFKPSSDDIEKFRKARKIPCHRALVLHVGTGFYKNRLGVVSIFEKIKKKFHDVHLVFVSSHDEALMKAIQKANLASDVTFLPAVSAKELNECYYAASVFLFPSIYEGFGLPIVEAQIRGIPVVCANGGALAEIAGVGAAVHDAADEDGMADSALRLLSSIEYSQAASAKGKANASKYSIQRWASEYGKCYQELAS